jgi:hypothetical protein
MATISLNSILERTITTQTSKGVDLVLITRPITNITTMTSPLLQTITHSTGMALSIRLMTAETSRVIRATIRASTRILTLIIKNKRDLNSNSTMTSMKVK